MLYLPLKTVKSILVKFEDRLSGYNLKVYYISDLQKVIVIEDTYILYVEIYKYLLPKNPSVDTPFPYGNITNPSLLKSEEGKDHYRLWIEEITHNSINFKYVHRKFLNHIETTFNIDKLSLCIFYRKFRGYTRLYWCKDISTTAEYVNEKLPQLSLINRYESWEGLLYYFIVLEFKDLYGITEQFCIHTLNKPHNYILSKCKEWIRKGNDYPAFNSWKGKSRKYRLENHFTYFSIEKYFREKDDAFTYQRKVLGLAKEGFYSDVERSTYTKPINRWKSEESVYNITKKLFNDCHVIYQFRPYYLKSSIGGQMSFDIYITDYKLAIEYQGEQHFKPIDFFGGEKGFQATVIRDSEKKEICKNNDIKLVYINYFETISTQLIKQKIENALST